MFRSARLEALFGKLIHEVTYDDIVCLIGNPAAAEAADLDYKRLVHAKSDEQKVEFCKDVVAMGNDQGGVLVIGVDEDDQAVPAAVPGVDISDGERRRLQEVLLQASPHLPVKIEALPDSPASGHGMLMVVVERSVMAPHAILDTRPKTHHKDGWLRYPIRNGASTRWMLEPEVATRYRRRFTEARSLAQRLDSAERTALSAYVQIYEFAAPEPDPEAAPVDLRPAFPVMVVSLAPEIPGNLRIDREVYASFQEDSLAEKLIVPGDVMITRYGIKHGRLLGMAGGARPPTRYAELHTDGSGVLVLHLEPPSKLRPDVPVLLVPIALCMAWLLSGLGFLGRHARDRAGASGVASIRAHLLGDVQELHGMSSPGSVVEHNKLQLADLNGWSWGEEAWTSRGHADAFLDDVADGGPRLVAAASLLGDALANGFGIAEVPCVTADGKIVPRFWPPFREEIERWAQASGVECVSG